MQANTCWVRVGIVAAVFCLLTLSVSGLSAQIGSTDATVDGGSLVQNEISLTLLPGLPGQPQVLLAAYNDDPRPNGLGLGVSRSTDGGANWSSAQLSYPTTLSGAVYNWSFDPTATADTQGNLFAAHIAADGNSTWGWVGGDNGLYVWRSADLGQTWTQARVAENGPAASFPDFNYRFNDRCQITADRFLASSYKDNVYISWIQDRGLYSQASSPPSGLPESDIYFSRSTDNGVTFSTPLQVNTPTQPGIPGNDMGNMPVPRVAANGDVYVSWFDYNVWSGGTGNVYLTRSTDGGQTFATEWSVTSLTLPPTPVRLNGGSDALAKGAPVLATSSLSASDLYLVYADDPDGLGPDESDIFFIKSSTSGNAGSWSTPLRLNTDITTNDQFLPWIDVKPNGDIDVAWYDRRNDPGDLLWDVYVTRSIDGGNSFLPEFRLNDQPFSTPTTFNGAWMGEYLGLVVDANYGYVAWTSSVNNVTGDVLFDKFANSAIVPEPSSLMLLGAAAAYLLVALCWRSRRARSCG